MFSKNGEEEIFKPGMNGLKNIIRSSEKCKNLNLFVLTSSLSAVVEPKPDSNVLTEKCWSDPDL